MKLKSYMRGLGIGIVVTALIMGVATKDGRPLTDAEIKAAAVKLGMVESSSLKLTDLDQDDRKQDGSGAALTPEPDATPDAAAASTPDDTAPATPESGATETPAPGGTGSVTPEPGATETPAPDGTGSVTPEPGAAATPAPDGTASATPEPGVTATPMPGGTAPATPEPGAAATTVPGGTASAAPESDAAETPAPESDSDVVTITVRSGTGSRSVCNQLAEAGLIEDAAAFDQYLIDSGYSKRISAGTFEIPVGASQEEIAKIISRSR